MAIILERLDGLEQQIRRSTADGRDAYQRTTPIPAPPPHPPPQGNIQDMDGRPGRWQFPGPSTMPSPEPDAYAGKQARLALR